MIISIVRHEFMQIMHARKVWFGAAAIQVMLALIFNWLLTNFLKHQATVQHMKYGITEEVIRPFYAAFALIFLICIPMLTTQAICAEKSKGSISNYFCAPITTWQIILGKFLSINLMLSLVLITVSTMPLMLLLSGKLDWGQWLGIFIGVYCMLNVAIAIGLSISCFMHNILRCSLFTLLGLIAFIMLEWAAQYMGSYAIFLQNFGMLKPLKYFLNGILSSRAVAFYLFVILSAILIGSKRLSHRNSND